MAASAAEARQALADLGALAARDLRSLWSEISGLSGPQARDALRDVLPDVFSAYGSAAGALAVDWYADMRDAADAAGAFAGELADLPTLERWDSLARWSVEPVFAASPDWDAALDRLLGGMQRTVADQHRGAIVRSADLDPAALGWRRVGQGHNCGFCNLLISRGDVYTQAGVAFKSHDRCNCIAAAVFEGEDVQTVSDLALRTSKRNISPETKRRNNQRAYAWIKAN